MAGSAVERLTKAYSAVEDYLKRDQQPEEFLTYSFLRKHPILLQPGMLRVNWNRIPGLSRRIDQISTVVVPDDLWGRWMSDWQDTWEPDEDPGHFHCNVALVVCRSRFRDNKDKKGRDKRVYSMAVAHIPDTIKPATLHATKVMFQKTKPDRRDMVVLTRLHKMAKFYPDCYFDRRDKHITLQHIEDRSAAGGVAHNFAGAELLPALAPGRSEKCSKLHPDIVKTAPGIY